MVRLTAKDIAAQNDPRRFHMLPPHQIAGTVDAEASSLRNVYTYLDAVHRSKCELGVTPLVVHRLTVLGVANDINYVVRAMAMAMREQGGGQLLLLPPAKTPESKRGKLFGDRTSLVSGRGMDRAWHWLDGLPGTSHRSIFWPSACQELLESSERRRLDTFVHLSRNGSTLAAAQQVGLGGRVFDAASGLKMLARGMAVSDVPGAYRAHGLLWWWQVLTTYTVRLRGPLADHVKHHPAMRNLAHELAGSPGGLHLQWQQSARHALRRATNCAPGDLGWVPSVSFDAGLHVRMGDACGPKARRHQADVRRCVYTLQSALSPLMAHGVLPHGGRLFLATDSPQIVREAVDAAAGLPFTVHFLHINRSKYDTEAWIELASAADRTQLQILQETLLDLFLLSRARYIAGSMYGNVPRVALQLRPTAPGDPRRLAYITTDSRDWCTKATCMANNTPTGRYW